MVRPRNVVFVLPDEWRGVSTPMAGDPNIRAPALAHLAQQSVSFSNAISGSPVCASYRATLISGRSVLDHGVFLNDVPLTGDFTSLGEALGAAGYATAWIGKWHLDGPNRGGWTPPERRRGFNYWRAQNLCHDPFAELYYGDDPEPRYWDGWAPEAQTADALSFAADRVDADEPFALFLSWGPPHDPLISPLSAPRFKPAELQIRDNVDPTLEDLTRRHLAAYYSCCTGLDTCLATLMAGLRTLGIENDTLVVWTSDHGTMMGSQGRWNKQQPWEESIGVPLLMRWPAALAPRTEDAVVDTPDLMPTLLGLCGIQPPETCVGRDLSDALTAAAPLPDEPALLQSVSPFGRWAHGREYRGIRTRTHTYVRDLDGPWLLYDNVSDPFQLRNLVADSEPFEGQLQARIGPFLSAEEHRSQWGYEPDATGAMPTAHLDFLTPLQRLRKRVRQAALDPGYMWGDQGHGPVSVWQALHDRKAAGEDLSDETVYIDGLSAPFSAEFLLTTVQPHRDPRWFVRAWAIERLRGAGA